MGKVQLELESRHSLSATPVDSPNEDEFGDDKPTRGTRSSTLQELYGIVAFIAAVAPLLRGTRREKKSGPSGSCFECEGRSSQCEKIFVQLFTTTARLQESPYSARPLCI